MHGNRLKKYKEKEAMNETFEDESLNEEGETDAKNGDNQPFVLITPPTKETLQQYKKNKKVKFSNNVIIFPPDKYHRNTEQ